MSEAFHKVLKWNGMICSGRESEGKNISKMKNHNERTMQNRETVRRPAKALFFFEG